MIGDFAVRNWNDIATAPQNDQDLVIKQACQTLHNLTAEQAETFRKQTPEQIYNQLVQGARHEYSQGQGAGTTSEPRTGAGSSR